MNRLLAGLLASALAAPLAFAQSFPTKPVLVLSSASPGSSGDAAIRMMAAKMTESLGQPVLVELRTAARGAQAHAVLSKSAPDGHTLTFGTSGTFVYGRFLYRNMVFDAVKDYSPVSLSLSSTSYVAVHQSLGINSMKELIEYTKKNPGKLEYASTGNGSFFHLAGEALKNAGGMNILHVPYAQANFPQMVGDWASGRVAMWLPTWNTLQPNLSRMKVLAILDRQRSKVQPDVPAITEVLPAYQPFLVWWGMFGPLGVPSPVANRIAADAKKAMLMPDVMPKLEDIGLTVVGGGPEELSNILRQDIAAIGTVVKAIGLQPE